MQVLVINGSPKGRGNTYKIVKIFENSLREIDNNINFRYLHLKDVNLEYCKGCYRCLSIGEDKCPLNDDRKIIEEAMIKADVVVFATPVYVMNVSGLYKNFLDRFAYICHRPMFHGKCAVVVCSTGALGTKIVNNICKMIASTWGFEVVGKIGGIVPKYISKEDEKKQWSKIEAKAKKVSLKLVKKLNKSTKPKASLFKLCTFKLQRTSFGRKDKTRADYNYWRDKGWLEPNCNYFIEAKTNPLSNIISSIIARIVVSRYPKG